MADVSLGLGICGEYDLVRDRWYFVELRGSLFLVNFGEFGVVYSARREVPEKLRNLVVHRNQLE